MIQISIIDTNYIDLIQTKSILTSSSKIKSFICEEIDNDMDQRSWNSSKEFICIIALTPITIQNGAWMYIPYTQYNTKPLSEEQLKRTNFVDSKHKKIREMKKKFVEMKVGDVLLLSPNTWYSKGKNENGKICKYLSLRYTEC